MGGTRQIGQLDTKRERLKTELKWRSDAKESGHRREEGEPTRSDLAHEPSRDGRNLGAGDRKTEHGDMVGTGQSTIRDGRTMSG